MHGIYFYSSHVNWPQIESNTLTVVAPSRGSYEPLSHSRETFLFQKQLDQLALKKLGTKCGRGHCKHSTQTSYHFPPRNISFTNPKPVILVSNSLNLIFVSDYCSNSHIPKETFSRASTVLSLIIDYIFIIISVQ